MLDNFIRMFLRGVAVVLPLAVCAWLTWYGVVLLYTWFEAVAEHPWRFPGLWLFATLGLSLVAGLFAQLSSTRSLIERLEAFLLRIPVLKHVYGTIKDLSDAFFGKHKRFDKPVLVKIGGDFDAEVLGFVTSDDLSAFGVLDKVAVYMPQSYNIGGNLLILPRSRLTPLEADSASVLSFIVSAGVTKLDEAGNSGNGVHGYSKRLRRAMQLRYASRAAD